jgi:hypothetical protein
LVMIRFMYILIRYLVTRNSHILVRNMCVFVITSYREASCIGNDQVHVHINKVPSYQEQSPIGKGHVLVCLIMITSYQ